MTKMELRLAVIAELARRSESGLGRTAIMKLIYFLQTLKGVPLGYTYRLYTYGPFDSEVLEDLEIAEHSSIVRSQIFQYPGGYGYQITAGEGAENAIGNTTDEIAPYIETLEWVMQEFGHRSAVDLEMASTIIYVDQSASAQGESVSSFDLCARVRAIKPHLSADRVTAEIAMLNSKTLLAALRLDTAVRS